MDEDRIERIADEVGKLRDELGKLRDREVNRGWTMLRGIWSALIPLMPVVAVLFVWGSNVNLDLNGSRIEIAYLKKADERHEQQLSEQRVDIISRLNKLVEQVDQLSRQMARVSK